MMDTGSFYATSLCKKWCFRVPLDLLGAVWAAILYSQIDCKIDFQISICYIS